MCIALCLLIYFTSRNQCQISTRKSKALLSHAVSHTIISIFVLALITHVWTRLYPIPDMPPCSKPVVSVFKQLRRKRVHPLHTSTEYNEIVQNMLKKTQLHVWNQLLSLYKGPHYLSHLECSSLKNRQKLQSVSPDLPQKQQDCADCKILLFISSLTWTTWPNVTFEIIKCDFQRKAVFMLASRTFSRWNN